MTIADSVYKPVDMNENGIIEDSEEANYAGMLYRATYQGFWEVYDKKKIQLADELVIDRWGKFLTSVSPIFDESGEVIALLGVDYLVTLEESYLNELLDLGIKLFCLSVALSFFLAVIIGIWTTQPLHMMMSFVKEVQHGNFSSRITMKRDDEFGKLASTIDSMVEAIESLFKELSPFIEEMRDRKEKEELRRSGVEIERRREERRRSTD